MTPVLPAVLMLYQKYSGVQYTGMKKEEHKDPVQMGGGSDLTVLATSNSANGSSQTPQSKALLFNNKFWVFLHPACCGVMPSITMTASLCDGEP